MQHQPYTQFLLDSWGTKCCEQFGRDGIHFVAKDHCIVCDRSKYVWQVESRCFNVQHGFRSLSDHQLWTTSDVPASEKERAAPFTTAPWKHVFMFDLVMVQLHRSPPPPLHHISLQKTIASCVTDPNMYGKLNHDVSTFSMASGH